jgi:hypothetical protein
MGKYFAVFFIIIATSFPQALLLTAQQAKQTPSAPIPASISPAKRIFVANAGGDERSEDATLFTGPDRAYNQFYAAMKTWGRYELVSTPADADLLFEIGWTAPAATVGSPIDPQIRLVIRDRNTNALLWRVIQHVRWAGLHGNRDKNFDKALAKIVAEVQRISSP